MCQRLGEIEWRKQAGGKGTGGARGCCACPASIASMGTKDPRADAEKYLEKHNVRGLFKHLSTKVREPPLLRCAGRRGVRLAWHRFPHRTAPSCISRFAAHTLTSSCTARAIVLQVLFAKPEDPKAFLVQELKKIQECHQEQKPVPSMFEEKDLIAMFGMFDVTGCVRMACVCPRAGTRARCSARVQCP